eukprot:COSAG02_NODE_22_length_53020_cov_16.223125_27_plen_76_part_00
MAPARRPTLFSIHTTPVNSYPTYRQSRLYCVQHALGTVYTPALTAVPHYFYTIHSTISACMKYGVKKWDILPPVL